MSDKERIAQLEAENARLKERTTRRITFKVSEKGAVSAYGLGRFPVTLYGTQWDALLAERDTLLTFLTENRAKLSTK